MAKRPSTARKAPKKHKAPAKRPRKAAKAGVKQETARLKRELAEALERQKATGEILAAISRSKFDLQAVLDTLTESAARLCGADVATVARQDETGFYHATNYNFPADWIAYSKSYRLLPDRGSVIGRALLAGGPVQIADVLADPEYAFVEQQKRAGFRTMLAAPLLRGGKPIGVFLVGRKTVAPFDDKQVALLSTFADQAVIAIENVRLFDEVKARTEDLRESLEYQTATGDILSIISRSPTDIQPVFEAIAASALRLCGAKWSMVTQLDGAQLQLAALHNVSDPGGVDAIRKIFPRRLGRGGPTDRAILSGSVVNLPDVLNDPEYIYQSISKAAGYRSHLAVPTIRDGKAIGAITVTGEHPAAFSERHVNLLKAFADQAVIAIENVRLFDEVNARTEDLRESLQQQTATADVLKVISRSTFDLQTVLDTLVESVTRLCEADHAWLFQREGNRLHFKSSFGHGTEVHSRLRDLFLSSHAYVDRGSIAGRSALEGRVVHVQDVLADSDYARSDAQKIGGYRAALGAPLLRDGNVVGVIFVAKTKAEPFTGKQIELVTTFADQAVIAIENVRLFEDLQARTADLRESLQQQTATADVLKVISRSAFDLNSVLSTLVASAAKLCEAERGLIFLREGEHFRTAANFGFSPELEAFARANPLPADGKSTTARAGASGVPVQAVDLLADETQGHLAREYQRLGGHRTNLGVPLRRDGETIGVFTLTRQVVEAFTPRQIELVQTFADQAVIAIENSRLLEQVRAKTRDLEESLEQQTATSEVLAAISSSLEELSPLFQTITENAVRVCGAKFGTMNLYDGTKFTYVAGHNVPHRYADANLNKPFVPHPQGGLATVAATHRAFHIEDVRKQEAYLKGDPAIVAISDVAGARTLAIVPMLKDDKLVGTLAIYRREVNPFNEKHVTLLSNFAKQAVIAIENNRLLKELRESLQQQTATADVLKVISRSTFDLKTVLQTLVASAAHLCDAEKATITRQRGNEFYRAESFGFSDEFMDFVRSVPVTLDRGSATARALLEGVVVHIPDVTADPDYTFTEGQKLGDFRTILGVPMLREGVPMGVIVLTRSEARPFTDKQIELATTFADQAAIAIENVRLFESVEARTRELAASLDDLRAAQDRLIQTEKLASLGQLTAGIAHEIKNPLNFVNNFSALSVELIDELGDVLKPAPLDGKTREDTEELTRLLKGNLEKVVQHGKRADSIVKNMLLHSREGSSDRRAVDVNALVGESLNLAYHGARAEGQDFQIRIEQDLDPAAGEAELLPQEITRVLLNLISNGFYAAMKRKAEDGANSYEPALTAMTRNLGNRVEIRIRDNGSGITPDVKEKMFNPFFTTKPPGEGTGLGLSLSHDIVVKQHAGVIEVDTTPGEFTEFRVVLPRSAAERK